jgi:hypothetical protein
VQKTPNFRSDVENSLVSRKILAVVEMSKWFFWSRVTPGVDLNEILQYSSSHYALSTSNIFGPCVGGLALLLPLVGDAAEVGYTQGCPESNMNPNWVTAGTVNATRSELMD